MSRIKTNRGAMELRRYFQSVTAVARELKIGPSHLSLLLDGKRLPSIQVAAEIEKRFGVPCSFWATAVTLEGKKYRDKAPSAARVYGL